MIDFSSLTLSFPLFRTSTGTFKRSERQIVQRIRERASELSTDADPELSQRIAFLKDQANGDSPASLEMIVSVYALTLEAARRILGIDLYDVQLLAGLELAQGKIVEMQTGEGKTYATLLPACLLALSRNGVHVMTVNAYLARRDYELLRPVYQILGLSVGLVESDLSVTEKRLAYGCDITYGPGYEFGFDYLRDQVALMNRPRPALGDRFRNRLHGRDENHTPHMQRGHAAAIIDEADSVMIDEATSPLVLAAAQSETAENAAVYIAARDFVRQLEENKHFQISDNHSSLTLTREGIAHISESDNRIPKTGLDRPWRCYVEQALRAEQLFRCNLHYVVSDGKVKIVDQQTGRIFDDRSWRDGLHQAIQAKEGVSITGEMQSIAKVTRQRFFSRYRHLCGMTGTAQAAHREIAEVYRLKIAVIPTNKPSQRKLLPTRGFPSREAKEAAIIKDVFARHHTGQPILIGTASIESSIRLADALTTANVSVKVLNGLQDEAESKVVAIAGEVGSITIATNMAGRGTDIKLTPGVKALGGLHVVVCEPQQSSRVDRQLIGRAARQGDPGSAQMFVSADDDLLIRYAPGFARQLRNSVSTETTSNAESIEREIQKIQRFVEKLHSVQRREAFEHDDWIEEVLKSLH